MVTHRLIEALLVVGHGQWAYHNDKKKALKARDFRRSGKEIFDEVLFEPTVMDVYPRWYRDQLPACVEAFCLPEGVKMKEGWPEDAVRVWDLKKEDPTVFTFMLTSRNGEKLYGVSLIWWDPLVPSEQNAMWDHIGPPMNDSVSLIRNASRTVTQKSLCMLTRHSHVHSVREVLLHVFKSQGGMHCPIEHLIKWSVEDFHLPPLGTASVQVPLGSRSLFIQRPSGLPVLEYRVHEVFCSLGVDLVVEAFHHVLTEKKLLVTGTDYAMLGDVVGCLLTLIWPMEWFHVAIPLLPHWSRFLAVLSAPVPFIIGVPRSYYTPPTPAPPDLVTLDLDNRTLTPPDNAQPLPRLAKKSLTQKLKKLLSTFSSVPATDKLPFSHPSFPKREIQLVFCKYLADILQGYKSQGFPSNVTGKDADFIREVTQSQAFQALAAGRMLAQKFDMLVEERSGRGVFRRRKAEGVLLEVPKKTSLAPGQPKAGELVRFDRFPQLSDAVLDGIEGKREVRPIDTRAVQASWRQALSSLKVLHDSIVSNSSEHKRRTLFGNLRRRSLDTSLPLSHLTSPTDYVDRGIGAHVDPLGSIFVGSISRCARISFVVGTSCKDCSVLLSEDLLMQKLAGVNDYRIACPNCKSMVSLYFTVTLKVDGGDGEECSWSHQVLFLSAQHLIKEVQNLESRGIPADELLCKSHATSFWNLLRVFRAVAVPVEMLLPQVNWLSLVDLIFESCPVKAPVPTSE